MRRLALLPCYNEAVTLASVLASVEAWADLVLVVDDASSDETAEVLARWQGGSRLCIRLAMNRGKSAALRVGLERALQLALADDDLVVLLDADGQHPVELGESFCRHFLESRADLLVARRDLRPYPWLTRIGNAFFAAWARLLTGKRLADPLSGMRVFRAGLLGDVLGCIGPARYACELEMCVALTLRGFQVADSFSIRPPHARSNPSWRDAWEIWLAGLRARRSVISQLAALAEPPTR